eukprot:4163909-Prymnesium_polylepis.1
MARVVQAETAREPLEAVRKAEVAMAAGRTVGRGGHLVDHDSQASAAVVTAMVTVVAVPVRVVVVAAAAE